AARELVSPIRRRVELVAEVRQPDVIDNLVDLLRRERILRPWIGERAPQGAQRQIGTLRQNQHIGALGDADRALAERPHAAKRAEQAPLSPPPPPRPPHPP